MVAGPSVHEARRCSLPPLSRTAAWYLPRRGGSCRRGDGWGGSVRLKPLGASSGQCLSAFPGQDAELGPGQPGGGQDLAPQALPGRASGVTVRAGGGGQGMPSLGGCWQQGEPVLGYSEVNPMGSSGTYSLESVPRIAACFFSDQAR